MFSVFHRVTQRRAERVWHRVEWLQNGGVLGVPRPPLVTFGAAARISGVSLKGEKAMD